MIHGVSQITHYTLCSHTLHISWTLIIISGTSVHNGPLELLVNIVQSQEIIEALVSLRPSHSAEVLLSFVSAGVRVPAGVAVTVAACDLGVTLLVHALTTLPVTLRWGRCFHLEGMRRLLDHGDPNAVSRILHHIHLFLIYEAIMRHIEYKYEAVMKPISIIF